MYLTETKLDICNPEIPNRDQRTKTMLLTKSMEKRLRDWTMGYVSKNANLDIANCDMIAKDQIGACRHNLSRCSKWSLRCDAVCVMLPELSSVVNPQNSWYFSFMQFLLLDLTENPLTWLTKIGILLQARMMPCTIPTIGFLLWMQRCRRFQHSQLMTSSSCPYVLVEIS